MTDANPPQNSAPPSRNGVTPSPALRVTSDLTSKRRYGTAAFIVVFLITITLFLLTIASILSPIILGSLLAAFTLPLQKRFEKYIPGNKVAPIVITLLIIFSILVPFGLFVFLLIERLNSLRTNASFQRWLTGGRLEELIGNYPWLKRILPQNLSSHLMSAFQWVATSIPSLLSGIGGVVLALFLAMLTTYYLLRDGRWLFERVECALPLEPGHTRAIIGEFKKVGRAVILGTVGTAILQGLTAGIGYLILGIAEALLLGALTAVASIVPVIGSGLVWIPMTIWLFINHQIIRAIILLVYSIIIVGLIDNIARPLLSKSGLELHPLLAFFGMFGGLATFGLSGLYLGPLFVALFIAVARIYEKDLAPTATAEKIDDASKMEVSSPISQSLVQRLLRKK